MSISMITLKAHERDAIDLLIKAIEAQPQKDISELVTSVRVLRQYLESPSHRLFSLAKVAFDDIEPEVKDAIRKAALDFAHRNTGASKTEASVKTITSELNKGKKKKSHASPFLAALDRK